MLCPLVRRPRPTSRAFSCKIGDLEKSMRRKNAVESFRSASETIGKVDSGMSLFAITRGQFSMLDAVLHCLSEIGPSSVSVWTWTIADYEIEAMEGLMARREIIDGRLIIDTAADKRNGLMIDRWRQRFGQDQVRICRNHAKIARVWNDRFRLLLRGSMNLNYNPRFEQLDITEGGIDFDLVGTIESELPVLRRDYAYSEVEAATKLGKAFEVKELAMFRGMKPWAK